MSDTTVTLGAIFEANAKTLLDELISVDKAFGKIEAKAKTVSAAAVEISNAFAKIGRSSSEIKKAVSATSEFDKSLMQMSKRGKAYENAFKAVTQGINKFSTANRTAANVVLQTDKNLAKVRAGFDQYLQKVQGIARGSAKWTQEMGRISQGAVLARASMAAFTGQIDKSVAGLTRWIAQSQKSLGMFGAFASAAGTGAAGLGKITLAYDQLSAATQRQITQAQKMHSAMGLLNNIQARTGASADKAKASTDKVTEALGKQESILGKVIHKFKEYATFMASATVVFGFINALRAGTSAIIDFDQALKNLQAISGATIHEIEAMSTKMLDIARETKFSSTEIGEGMVLLAQAGLSAGEAIETIQAVANLATGTLTDMATTADLVTSTMRAFNIEAKEANRIADVFANAINKSKLTVDKLRTSFNYVGISASQAGVSLEEVAASMMVLANNGMRASTIGTGLRQVIAKMLAPTDKMAAALQAQGVALEDLNPKLIGYEKVLENLSGLLWDNAKGAVDMGKAYDYFRLRGAQAAAAITEAFMSGKYDEAMDMVKRLGTAMEMADTQALGLAVKFKNAADRAGNLAIAIGERGLAGAFGVLADTMKVVFTGLESFVKSDFGGLVTQLGLATAGIASLAKAAQFLNKAFAGTAIVVFAKHLTRVATSFGAAGAAIWAKRGLMRALQANPFIVWTTAISGLLIILNRFSTALQRTSEEARIQAIAFKESAETLSFYRRTLEELSKRPDDSYENMLERFSKEQGSLAESLRDLLGVVDLASLAYPKLAEAMLEVEKVKITGELDEQAKSLQALYDMMERQRTAAMPSENLSPLLAAPGQKVLIEQLDEATENYKDNIRDLAKTFLVLNQKYGMNRVEILKMINSMRVGPEVARDLADAMLSAIAEVEGRVGRVAATFRSSVQELPRDYRRMIDDMSAADKVGFVEFNKNLGSRISQFKDRAEELNLAEKDRIESMAALRAKEYADYMLENNKMLDAVQDREQKAVQIVRGFIDQTVREYRKASISRQEAEGRIIGYMEVVNEKYVAGIRRAYDKVKSIVSGHIRELEGQYDRLRGQVESTNEAIENVNKSYMEDMRDVQQKTMSDEERWLNDREEANRLLAEGIKTQNAEMVREAQSMFKGLARDVVDESGKTIASVEQTADAAKEGITKSHEAAVAILEKQRAEFKTQMDAIRGEIQQTEAILEGYRKKIEEISQTPFTLNTSRLKETFEEMTGYINQFRADTAVDGNINLVFTGTASDTKLLGEKIEEIQAELGDLRKDAEETDSVVNVDFQTSGGLPVDKAIEEIRKTIKDGQKEIQKDPITLEIEAAGDVKEWPSVFELMTGAMTKAFGLYKSTIGKMFAAKNIFKVAFIGDADKDEKPLFETIQSVYGRIKGTSEQIDNIKATFTTLFKGEGGANLSEESREILSLAQNTSEKINSLKSYFTAMFVSDDGIPFDEAALKTVEAGYDVAAEIGKMATKFMVSFEAETGIPFEDRVLDIIDESKSLSDLVSNLGSTFTTDFLSADGLATTAKMGEVAKSAEGLAGLIEGLVSTFTVSFMGENNSVKPLTEKIKDMEGGIMGMARRVGRVVTSFITKFTDGEGNPLSSTLKWVKENILEASKYVKGKASEFKIKFSSENGKPITQRISETLKGFEGLKQVIGTLGAVFSVRFWTKDGAPLEEQMEHIKKRMKLLSDSINETITKFRAKFETEEGISFGGIVEWVKGKFKALSDYINKTTAEMTADIKIGGMPLSEGLSWAKDQFMSLVKFIGGLLVSFIAEFSDATGIPLDDAIEKMMGKFSEASGTISGMKTAFEVFVSDEGQKMPIEDKLRAVMGDVEKTQNTINAAKAALKIGVVAAKTGAPIPEEAKKALMAATALVTKVNDLKATLTFGILGDDGRPVEEQAADMIDSVGGALITVQKIGEKFGIDMPKALIGAYETAEKLRDGLSSAAESASGFFSKIGGSGAVKAISGFFNLGPAVAEASKELDTLGKKADALSGEKKVEISVEGGDELSNLYAQFRGEGSLLDRAKAGAALFRIAFTGSDGTTEGVPVSEQVDLLKENLNKFSTWTGRLKTGLSIFFGTDEGDSFTDGVKKNISKATSFSKSVGNINAIMRLGIETEDGDDPIAFASNVVHSIRGIFKKADKNAEKVKTFFTDGAGKPVGDAIDATEAKLEEFSDSVKKHSPNFVVNLVTDEGEKTPEDRLDEFLFFSEKFKASLSKLNTNFTMRFIADNGEPLIDKILNTGKELRQLAEDAYHMGARYIISLVGQDGEDFLVGLNKKLDEAEGIALGFVSTIGDSFRAVIDNTVGYFSPKWADALGAMSSIFEAWTKKSIGMMANVGKVFTLGFDLKTSISDKAEIAAEKVKTALTDALTAPAKIASDAKNGISAAFVDFMDKNKSVVAGIKLGIKGLQEYFKFAQRPFKVMASSADLARKAITGLSEIGRTAFAKLSTHGSSAAKAFTAMVAKVPGLSTGLAKIAGAAATVASKFNMVMAAVQAFFIGWDLGRIIGDMDLFGTLPMKVNDYTMKAYGYIHAFLLDVKKSFAEAMAWITDQIPGLGLVSGFFNRIKSETETSLEEVERTIKDINPLEAMLDDNVVDSVAVRMKRAMETISKGLVAKAVVWFRGRGSSETDLSEKTEEMTGLTREFEREANALRPRIVTSFVGEDGEPAKKSFWQTILEFLGIVKEGTQKVNDAMPKKSLFEKLFDWSKTGSRDHRVLKSTYNEFEEFYGKLDSRRKISFEKFFADTKSEAIAYQNKAKSMKHTEEEISATVQSIWRERFEAFKKIAEDEMKVTRQASIQNVLDDIAAKTKRIQEESSKKIEAYQNEITELERLKVEAESTFLKKEISGFSPKNSPLYKALNESIGVLSEMSEEEIRIAKEAHAEKVRVYLGTLSTEEKYARGKELFLASLKESIGDYSKLSGEEIDAAKKQNAALAQYYGIVPDVSQVQTIEDKIRAINLKMAQERVSAIRESLGLAATALDDYAAKEKDAAARSLGIKKDALNKETAATAEAITDQERLDLEYAIERHKFWSMNEGLIDKHNQDVLAGTKRFYIDMETLEKEANEAKKRLYESDAQNRVQGAEKKKKIVVDVAKEMTKAEKQYAEEVKDIDEQVLRAKKKHYEEARQALKSELEASLQMEKDVANEILDIRRGLAEEQKSVEEWLRDQKREGMSEQAAYEDKWAEINEKYNKAVAMGNDRYEEKIKLIKEAMNAAKGMTGEIKDEEKVIISAERARSRSTEAVKKMFSTLKSEEEGRIKVLERAQAKTEEHTATLQKTLAVTDGRLEAIGKRLEQEVNAGLDRAREKAGEFMDKLESGTKFELDTTEAEGKLKKLAKMAKDITSKMGDTPLKYATGGRVPGSGTGDTVPAMLTPNEHVIDVPTVQNFGGHGFFNWLRSRSKSDAKDIMSSFVQKFSLGGPVKPVMPKISVPKMVPQFTQQVVQHFATGGAVRPAQEATNMGKMDLTLGNTTVQVYDRVDQIEQFKEQIRMEKRRRPNDFAMGY